MAFPDRSRARDDPNSVYVYGAYDVDPLPMIAMPLVPGGTCSRLWAAS
jgi:hypothetical protein